MEQADALDRSPTFSWTTFAVGCSGRHPKVLVCDDERHIVRLVQVNLERQGYRVVTAFDGEQGLEKILAERPDLCILDADMPKMGGFEVLRRMRQDPATKDIPVVMLKVAPQDVDRDDHGDGGANLYLTKPFNPTDLFK